MKAKVNDLTVSQLKDIISEVVRERIDDVIEDLKSLVDYDYIESVKEARKEYKEGKVTNIDDIMNV